MEAAPEDYVKFANLDQARALRGEFDAYILHVVLTEGTFADLLQPNHVRQRPPLRMA